jgi:lipoate-protein ligase A
LPTPAENLALDEALLDEAESAGRPTQTLRLWEPSQPVVVVGRSSRIAEEVRLDVCGGRGIAVLRRVSGGAAIVTGPGCLMYAVVISYERHPMLRAVDHAHRFVLEKIAGALQPHVPEVRLRGTSDLAVGERKFSGNSIRAKRDHLLYHGTLLYRFPLDLVAACLALPPRQPDYRRNRGHAQFVTNLPLPASVVRSALAAAWEADEPRRDWPRQAVDRLVAGRYSQDLWNVAGKTVPDMGAGKGQARGQV